MMFCCDLSPQVMPSPEGERWSNFLKYVAIGHLVIAVLYFIGGGASIAMGLMDLIFAWFVFISYRTYNYCFLTIYIWFLVFNIISTFVYVGTFIQYHDQLIKENGGYYAYFLTIFSIAFAFYCTALYVAYRAYKEFKALSMFPFIDGAAGQCMTFLFKRFFGGQK